jgi:TPR repeat protein
MREMPLSLGETPCPGDNEVRWFEPVAPDPEASEAVASATSPVHDAVRWRDVRWVGFETAGDADAAEELTAPISHVAPSQAAAYLADEPIGEAPGPEQTASDPALHEEMRPLAADPEEIRQEASIAPPAPVVPGTRPVRLRRCLDRACSMLRGLTAVCANRAVQVCVIAGALAVIVGLSFGNGERLAKLADAMTRPQGSLEATTPGSSAAVEPAAPEPAPIDQAAMRAAAYLERANAGDAAAQYNLAVLYARGEGLAQDYGSAAAWFVKAAASGNLAAQFNLGVLYQRGLGVPQDSTVALRWYRRAAERHYPPAEYNLAVAYAEGQGTPRDPVAAARWYHQAAMQGLVPAMINFAILYEKGEGVERSPLEAYAWYRTAAQRGDAVAEKRGGELFSEFDPATRRRAQDEALTIAGSIRQPPVEIAASDAASPAADNDPKPSTPKAPSDPAAARGQGL